jgi:hypothetical protein
MATVRVAGNDTRAPTVVDARGTYINRLLDAAAERIVRFRLVDHHAVIEVRH